MSSLELGTCSHMPCSKSESVRVRALFYARVCVFWFRCKPMDAEDYEEYIPLLYEVLAGQKGQDLVKNVVLVGTRSNMKLPGTPSYPLLAWRMVLWATTSAMATAKATMMLRTWW
ncbi:hypothetical protein VPH35_065711 [Triticum aestivum]